MKSSTSLRLRLLAIASLSLPACSDSPEPAASPGGAAGTTAEAGAPGSAGQGGTSGSGGSSDAAGTSGSGGTSGAGGASDAAGASGAAGAADQCVARHPGVGQSGGSGGTGNLGLPRTAQRCYQPSAEEQAAGCLPTNSPQLLDDGLLSHEQGACTGLVLSVHGEATKTSGACAALAGCCAQLPPGEQSACPETAQLKDEGVCASKLSSLLPSCLPAAQPDAPVVCCYETCTSLACPGRPLVVEEGVRMARLQRTQDAGWG